LDYATIGDGSQALDLLERMAEAHTGMDPKTPAGRPFKNIANDPRFLSLVAQIEKENPPVVRSTTALLIGERDLFPEGIAYDAVGKTFYVSSISKQKILAVGLDGSANDFKVSGQDGLGETLGMKVDAKRRILWVISDSFAQSVQDKAERQGVFQYDLITGALRFKHLLPPGSGGFLNDVALTSTGEAFATNTGTGEVFRASPDHDGLEPFLPPNSVIQANGIAVSPDDKLLFVAGWVGVARVDIATRQVRLLAKPRSIADANIDGLVSTKVHSSGSRTLTCIPAGSCATTSAKSPLRLLSDRGSELPRHQCALSGASFRRRYAQSSLRGYSGTSPAALAIDRAIVVDEPESKY
jgi:hypothetical protein